MLKKLVKYGNSNALVLDKAILELLNIQEGSVVKISTDGRSIILTPQQAQLSQEVHETFTFEDATMIANFKEYMKLVGISDPVIELQLFPLYKEQSSLLQEFYKKPENLAELKNIAELYKDDLGLRGNAQKTYMKKASLRLGQVIDAIDAIQERHGNKDMIAKCSEFQLSNQVEMYKEFRDFFAKYAEQSIGLSKILNSSEYQHEAQLLTEKFQGSYSAEFLKELHKLRIKFDPKFEDMDKDMEAIMKKYQPDTK